ncbi:MAG: phospholipid carrier-dependent glycosyltransferase [Xanthomonadaceae bacterium]|nr:phospholipid carrier-dependent glycosyltransferase [Xanthomonadaceae bacterium]
MLIDRIRTLSIFVALAIGMVTTLWGFSQISWPTESPFAWDSLRRTVLVIAAGALVLVVLSSWLKVNRLAAGAIAACAIAIFTGTIWPLIVTIWLGFASYVLGRATLTLLKIDKEKLPNITAVLVGAAVYGTAVGFAAHFSINYPGLYGFVLAVPVVLGWRDVCAAVRSLGQFCSEKAVSKWHDLAIALIALVHFSVALMPEVGHDALAMHLFIPAHLATRHEWGFDVDTYVWAVMPMMGDWLFSMGYMLAGETAARLINVGFIFVLSWLVRDLVIWAGGSALGARWAVLLFLTTPLTFTESSSLFIESVWAAFIVAGALSVFKLIQNQQQNVDQAAQLKVAGLLLGAAAAAKAVTFTILPVLLLLLVLRYRTWGQRKLIGAIALGLILFIAVGGIPYATAWHLTGNPVFPFFNQIFKSPFWPAVAFEAPTVFGKGLSWDVIYQATFHTDRFLESKLGAPGFQWLLLFIPSMLVLLIYRHYKGILLFAVAGLCIALTFQSITYLRYIFPSFVWVAAGIGVALSSVQMDAAFTRRVLSVVGWAVVSLNLVFFKSGTYYGDLSLQPLTSQTGRETYLNNRLPIRNAIELVNQINVGRAPVAVFSSPLTAGLNSDGLYPNWYNHQFQAKVTAATTSGHIAQLLMDKGVNYVILDSNWGATDKREIIEDATVKISEQGSITVRKLKSSYQFQTELLKNPDFSSYDGWTFPVNTYEQTSDQITVSVSSPSSQLASVVAGRRYQNSVTAFCKEKPTQGRVQVNWLDSESKFISTDIRVFDCTPTATTHAMEVTAPRNASKAAVYATGHTNIPIIISEVSFKR